MVFVNTDVGSVWNIMDKNSYYIYRLYALLGFSERQQRIMLIANIWTQDTGSSNGTFINNIRLSKCGEQSKLTEIYSEDTLRFGSDVVDKAKNVTQKCVVVALRLWYPDGLEYDSRPTSSRLYRKKINKSLFIVLPRVYRKGALNNKSSLTHFDFQTAN